MGRSAVLRRLGVLPRRPCLQLPRSRPWCPGRPARLAGARRLRGNATRSDLFGAREPPSAIVRSSGAAAARPARFRPATGTRGAVLVVVLVVGNQFHLRLFRWSGPASTAVAFDGRVTVIGDQDLEAVELRLELPVPRRQPSPPARHHVPGRSGLWGTNGRRSSSFWELSTTSTASKSSTVLRRFESESCTARLPLPCLRSDRCSS